MKNDVNTQIGKSITQVKTSFQHLIITINEIKDRIIRNKIPNPLFYSSSSSSTKNLKNMYTYIAF